MPAWLSLLGGRPPPTPAAATAKGWRPRQDCDAGFAAVREGVIPPTPRAFLAVGPTSIILVEVLSVRVTGSGECTTVVYRIRRTPLV